MAISEGSTVLQSDIKSKYDSFNNFIQSYGGTIAKLTVPGQYTVAYASQFNALNNKVNEFKNDTYLKTQASWWVAGPTVVAGTSLLDDGNFTNINTTISNFSKVKCRNNAYNSNSTRSHSTNSHTVKSHTNRGHSTNSHGTKENGSQSNGGKWNGNNGYSGCNGYQECTSNGANDAYGAHNHGVKSHTNCTANGANSHGTNNHTTCSTNGTCKNTTYIDITNSYTNS